jgi:hypothetical protein
MTDRLPEDEAQENDDKLREDVDGEVWAEHSYGRELLDRGDDETEVRDDEYPLEWERISSEYRESVAYTCEDCGVFLGDEVRYLHVHHKDGNKRNCEQYNLEAVCVLCHDRRHGHLDVTERAYTIITERRNARHSRK